jgi:Zn-dependent protease
LLFVLGRLGLKGRALEDSLRLGRVGGVKIGANWSIFALAAIVAYFLASSRLPTDVPGYTHEAYWVAGSLTAVALLVGVLVHEVAHAVAARRAKLHVDGITLWFMGGVTRIESDSRKPSIELVVSLVGPLASGVLGGVSFGLAALAQLAGWDLAAGSLRWLGVINVLLGAFNLLPASPLDGGKVLHGLLWLVTKNRWLATRLAAGAGLVLGAACSIIGLVAFEENDAVDGFVLLLMGWFVISSSKREQLAGKAQYVLGDVRISDVMRPAVIAPGWLTVNAFWNEWVSKYPDAAFLLERWGGGGWSGAVTAQQLAAVPPGMQWSVRAQDVSVPLEPPLEADQVPLAPGLPALAVAGRGGAALPVMDHEAPVGVVLAADITALVARGTPAPRRTWATVWSPAPAPTQSRYA